MKRQTQFRDLFCYREDIRLQVRKSRGHSFSLDTEVLIFLNYCYWVFKHTQIPFCLIVSIKTVRSLQRFSESVRVVFAMSA